jgi:uncharacterized membrane protein
MKVIKRHFLTGLIVVTPMALTGWILWRSYKLIDMVLQPLLGRIVWLQDRIPDFLQTLLGVLVLVAMVMVVGLFTRNLLGATFFGLLERLVNRIPIVKGIFSVTKQISEVLLTEGNPSFKQVIAFEYPRTGIYAIGFVTHDDPNKKLLNVFLPTTPNPTSGFMLMVPREEAHVLPISVEEGIKQVISGGAVISGGDGAKLETYIVSKPAAEPGGGESGDQ